MIPDGGGPDGGDPDGGGPDGGDPDGGGPDVGGPDGGGPDGGGPELSLDAVFGVLSDRHCRDVLRHFHRKDTNVASTDELVDVLVEREIDRRRSLPDPKNLALSLHHIHLPRLTDLDLVEVDHRSQEVRYHGDPALDQWLAVLEERHD